LAQTINPRVDQPAALVVDEYNDACFIVQDGNGQQLAYVYFEEEPGRRSSGARVHATNNSSAHQSQSAMTNTMISA
jgi:hypothetical protein